MSIIKVGLNGFGRIGRAFARIATTHPDITIEAINTSKTTPGMLAYFLKYDSVYRTFDKTVVKEEDGITVDGKKIHSYNYRNPADIPWSKHHVDVVVDCTGVFKTREDLDKHLGESVKKVILSVPADDDSIPYIVLGVNDKNFDFAGSDIISNASCTTNCAALMVQLMDDEFGVESSLLSTIHAYTSSQKVVDTAAPKFTRGRAAALSIIPTTTGASGAVCKVSNLTQEKIDGIAIRVPTPVGSLTDLVVVTKKKTSIKDVNQAFKKASETSMKGYLAYEETPLVSSDYIGSPYSCTFDANYTSVINGNLVKIFGWYDNEWGYTSRLIDLVERIFN